VFEAVVLGFEPYRKIQASHLILDFVRHPAGDADAMLTASRPSFRLARSCGRLAGTKTLGAAELYRVMERARDLGLKVTAHAGETS